MRVAWRLCLQLVLICVVSEAPLQPESSLPSLVGSEAPIARPQHVLPGASQRLQLRGGDGAALVVDLATGDLCGEGEDGWDVSPRAAGGSGAIADGAGDEHHEDGEAMDESGSGETSSDVKPTGDVRTDLVRRLDRIRFVKEDPNATYWRSISQKKSGMVGPLWGDPVPEGEHPPATPPPI